MRGGTTTKPQAPLVEVLGNEIAVGDGAGGGWIVKERLELLVEIGSSEMGVGIHTNE